MKFATAAVFLALVAVSVCAETAREMEEVNYEIPIRASDRQADVLRSQVSDRAALLLRALDGDHDKLISATDARAAPEILQRFLPGVSADDFASFIQLSDADGDQKLSQQELNNGLAAGLKEVPEFLQLAEETSTKKGFFDDLGKIAGGAVNSAWNGAKQGMKNFVDTALGKNNGVAPTNNQPMVQNGQSQSQNGGILQQIAARVNGAVDSSQDSCVICQYILERCETNVKQAGVIPSMAGAAGVSFLEEKVEVKAQDPFDAVGSAIIGATRQSTRVQRQLERQKYNEIYRVVDITLDDVCEQAMPGSFYGYCKQMYQVQSDVVDGLRYQYRPSDICFRVGMCGANSYITRGIHSRYK